MVKTCFTLAQRALLLLVALSSLFALFAPPALHPIRAQDMLELGDSVEGEIAAGESVTYSFSAVAGQLVSFAAEAVSGDLDPVLTVSSSDRTLISDDDYAPPESRDARLEAITLPRTDVYTVEVSAYGSTSGEFTLRALPGFSEPAAADALAERGWTPAGSASNGLIARASENGLQTAITGVRALGLITNTDQPEYDSFFASVDVAAVENREGWVVGLAAVQDANTYYALDISSQGLWRLRQHEGGEDTNLRDWSNAPPIRPGETAFRLGMLVRNHALHLYYNDAPLGIVAADDLDTAGQPGLVLGTESNLESSTQAAFAALTITTPVLAGDNPVRPAEMILADASTMSQSLIRRTEVDGRGALVLNVPQSSVQYARAGVNRQMVGQGTRYTTFALGTTMSISGGGENGCGVVFGYSGEADYWLAYVDAAGGYGLSRRTADGFEPGLHAQAEQFAGGAREHHLLILQNTTTLTYYLDGLYVGSLETPPQEGEIGIAAVNQQPTSSTTCTATNLWLWRSES